MRYNRIYTICPISDPFSYVRYDRTHIYVNICAVRPVFLYCPIFDPFSHVRYDRTHISAVRPVFLYLLTLCPFLCGSQSRTGFVINFETNFGYSRSYYKITFVINKALKIRLTSFEHSNITSEARELKLFKRKHLEIFYFTA